MVSTVSRPSRLVSVVTALLTVWCLGCSGFEPLVAALVSDGDAACPPVVAQVAHGGDGSGIGAAHEGSDAPCACIETCLAASPGPAAPLTTSQAPARAGAADLIQPPSIARAPLLPPPERRSA